VPLIADGLADLTVFNTGLTPSLSLTWLTNADATLRAIPPPSPTGSGRRLLRLNRELRRELHSLGVTGEQVSLLIKIQKEPRHRRPRARALGAHVDARDVQVRRAARGRRLVRGRSSQDRRRVGLELTAEGARVLASVKRRRTAWLAERPARPRPDELDAVDAAVEPLLKLLEVEA
jgi:DNA-binding MarR family transcriptional regulator